SHNPTIGRSPLLPHLVACDPPTPRAGRHKTGKLTGGTPSPPISRLESTMRIDRTTPYQLNTAMAGLAVLIFAGCCFLNENSNGPEQVGPWIGAVTPTSARIHMRPALPGQTVTLFYSPETGASGSVARAGPFVSSLDNDNVVRFDLAGLNP